MIYWSSIERIIFSDQIQYFMINFEFIFILILFIGFILVYEIVLYIITIIFFQKHIIEKNKKYWMNYVFGVVSNPPLSPLTPVEKCIHYFDDEGKKQFPRMKKLHNIGLALLVFWLLSFFIFLFSAR